MGKFLAGLLVAAKAALVKLVAKVGLLLAVAVASIFGWVERSADDIMRLLKAHEDDVITVAQRLAQRLTQTEEARAATQLMVDAIWQTFRVYWVAVIVIAVSCAVVLLATCIPLAYRALVRNRPKVFLSFQHGREPLAVSVENALRQDAFLVYRLPYREDAAHQHTVTETTKAIRQCNAVVCLPGSTESYVDNEVAAATYGFKPIAFALPSHGGTLPDSADKRYPVFRLEAIQAEHYEPLAQFLHYVVADLRSALQQCWDSTRHPFVLITWRSAILLLCIVLFALFMVSWWQAFTATEGLAARGGAFAEHRTATVLSTVGVLLGFASAVLLVAGYGLLVVTGIWRQWKAQRRACLKVGTANFTRDDWVGVIPGMFPGSKLYNCLFDTAPSAHHEAHRLSEQV